MTVTYRIDIRERIVYLNFTDLPTFGKWEAALEAVLADPSYGRGFNFLSDQRSQDAGPATEFIMKAALFLAAHTREMGRFRWASVSLKEPTFGMTRAFSILTEETGIDAQAFKDYYEARRWLLA